MHVHGPESLRTRDLNWVLGKEQWRMRLSNPLEVVGVTGREGDWDTVCGALITSWRTLHVQECRTFEVFEEGMEL